MKLLDSYLQPSEAENILNDYNQLGDLAEFLTGIFFALSSYTQQAIARSLGSSSTRHDPAPGNPSAISASAAVAALSTESSSATLSNVPREELDLLLPKVCEALVLVTQCLISLSLYSEEALAAPPTAAPGCSHPTFHLKDVFIAAIQSVEAVIGMSFERLAPDPLR